MTEYLIVQLAESNAPAAWAAFDTAGHLLSSIGRGPLEGARALANGRRVIALVPGADVISTAVQLPASGQSRLRQILPYSLEEALAEDVEALAFAAGPRTESGLLSAAVVAKRRLDAWLAELAAAGLVPQAMYSEADGVPSTPATLTLLIDGSRIYARRAGQPPAVFEGLGLAQALDLIRGGDEEAPDLKRLLIYVDEAGRDVYRRELAELQERAESVDVKLAGDGLFARLAATIATKPGTNLLQGPYAPKSNWIALARPWRLAAGLLVAAGLVMLVAQSAEYFTLRREDAALTDMIASGCQRLISSERLSACEPEVQSRLRDAGAARTGAGATFLSALAAVAASRDPASRIQGLSYRNRTMDLQVVASSVPALERLASAVDETGRFEAVIESANPSDDGVDGRVKIVER